MKIKDVSGWMRILVSKKNATISTGYRYLKGGTTGADQRPQEDSLLEHTTTFSIEGKTDSTTPLVEIAKGAQILLVSAEKNSRLSEQSLEFYDYNGSRYYRLEKKGTYHGVWLSGVDGNYIYADTVTVSGAAGDRTYDIRVYIPKGKKDTDIRLEYLTLVNSAGTPKFGVSGTVWGGDHQGRRITDYYGGVWLNYKLDKEIVDTPSASEKGRKSSAIAEGDTVNYRICMAAYDGIQGPITLHGDAIRDILPKSLAGTFSWNEENVKVDYNTTADSKCQIENPKSWSITTDTEDANQQSISWGSDFSITFTEAPVYIYVTLTYPTGKSWDTYSETYASTSLSNTVETLGLDSSVEHTIKLPGKAVLQQGVLRSYLLVGPEVYSQNIVNTGCRDQRWTYSTAAGCDSIVEYYVAVKNDGKTRLYLTDIQGILPQGFHLKSPKWGNNIIYNGTHAVNSETKKYEEKNLYFQIKPSTVRTTQNGQDRVKFVFQSGNTSNYDKTKGLYFLEPGQSIQFQYSCYVGARSTTADVASNTVTMPYYDVTEAGVNVGSTRYTTRTGKESIEIEPNDDPSPRINPTAWAREADFDTTNQADDGQWLTSTVSMYRGKAELGLEKSLTSTSSSTNGRPSTVGNNETLNWCVKATNRGTSALEDYVITDVIDAPYQIKNVSLRLYNDNFNYRDKQCYATVELGNLSFDPATKTIKNGNTMLEEGIPKKFSNSLYYACYDSSDYGSGYTWVDYEISYTWEGEAPVISFRLISPKMAISRDGWAELCVTTKKPDGSEKVNQTYVNTAWLTPLLDGIWDEAPTAGILDPTLETGFWENKKTSIRSSANVVVSFGYSTSSTLEAKQTYDGKEFTASSDAASTAILPDKNGTIHYTMTVDNTVYKSASALTKLVLIDNLPEPGDHSTFQSSDLRGSEYKIDLAENPNFKVTITVIENDQPTTKILDSNQYHIEYTKETSFDRTDWNGESNGKKWTDNSAGARSFRIIIDDPNAAGEIMPAHSKIQVEFDAKVADPAAVKPGQMATNSFGYHYEVKNATGTSTIPLEAAPLGVGLRTPYVPTLQKRLETPDGIAMAAGANAKFKFVIYDGAAVTLQDDFTENELATALRGHTYTYVEKTVAPGQVESDAPWLKDLKQYSYVDNTWKAGSEDWTWKNGENYHVIELPVTGDYRYGSINRRTARSYSFTYNYANKNTLQCVNIGTSWAAKLTKTAKDTNAPLADAYFALYSPAQADQMLDASYNKLAVTKKPAMRIEQDGATWYLKSVEKTKADGTLTWAGLSASDYLYVEVQAPNGYNLDNTVSKVTRPTGGGTASVSVTNRPGYNLPETGGVGTWPFMAAGLLLTGTALVLLLKKRRTDN